MLIIKPFIFNQFHEITFGFSTKSGPNANPPYYFNMSFSVGDEKVNVDANRNLFFNELGLSASTVSFQKQVHDDKINYVETYGDCGESDALITKTKNLGLAISSADCPAIFIFDPVKKIIAAVHSGWKGTEKQILKKTIRRLKNEFSSNSKDLFCYIGPSISQKNYEVGKEVAAKFDEKFILKKENKLYLDLARANFNMLIIEGVKEKNIQVSKLCSFEYSNLLHSYRRDGSRSGRALGVIAIRE